MRDAGNEGHTTSQNCMEEGGGWRILPGSSSLLPQTVFFNSEARIVMHDACTHALDLCVVQPRRKYGHGRMTLLAPRAMLVTMTALGELRCSAPELSKDPSISTFSLAMASAWRGLI